MAFHESHERACPFCNARMSATAPKCLNCGRLVDEEDEDDTPDRPRVNWGLVLGIAGGLVCAALIAYALRGRKSEPAPNPGEADVQKLHEMMGRMAGRGSLNASSPMTWAELEPEFRVGRPFDEIQQAIGRKNFDPNASTLIGSGGATDGTGWSYFIYLKDATVKVRIDADKKVAAWERGPAGS